MDCDRSYGAMTAVPRASPGVEPSRTEGYAPLRDYAAIGDGRTVALVALDGSIDWLPLPDLDSPTVFAAVLDRARGGRFALRPALPFTASRRYLPGTNVLETTFTTAEGVARVTDALTLPAGGLVPGRELQRRLEGLAGTVRVEWQVEPRFGYGAIVPAIRLRPGHAFAARGSDGLAVLSYGAGEPRVGSHGSVEGELELVAGAGAVIALAAAHQEPIVLPSRSELDHRFEHTVESWKGWVESRAYAGPYRDAVIRSALALKLLVYAPSGGVAAAATTSLPETIGGERNWDYRFSWIRDSAFTLGAFLELGCSRESSAYFWWLMHASQLTHPHLQVLYRLNGGSRARERELPLSGYRGSTPVRVGNGAVDQVQLDTYGELLETAWLYHEAGYRFDPDVARRLGEIADLVCEIWRRPDAGIWEVRSEPLHFTQSKMMCWLALERAARLAEKRALPRKHLDRWSLEARAVAEFVEQRCWSSVQASYVRSAGAEELDASVLLGVLFAYGGGDPARLESTVEAVRRSLSFGPYVHRYTGEDGLRGKEGAFLACSFWLVEALARTGRRDEAANLLEQLIGLANDVGLYAEEIDPESGDFLGNMPQGLSHLALIRAAAAVGDSR